MLAARSGHCRGDHRWERTPWMSADDDPGWSAHNGVTRRRRPGGAERARGMQLQELRRLEATAALLGDRLERLLVAMTLTLDLHREAERRLIASGGTQRNAPGTSPAD